MIFVRMGAWAAFVGALGLVVIHAMNLDTPRHFGAFALLLVGGIAAFVHGVNRETKP